MNGRTPASTDESGALSFEDRPARPQNGAAIHVAYQGVPVDLQLVDKKIGQVEDLIKTLLARGWTAPPMPRGGFGARPDNRIDPAFDDAGNEVCPTHHVPLRTYKTQDGREFKGCPSRGTGAAGEKINAKGYCDLRFK